MTLEIINNISQTQHDLGMTHYYCEFNRRLNGFNWKVDQSAMSGIQHTKQGYSHPPST